MLFLKSLAFNVNQIKGFVKMSGRQAGIRGIDIKTARKELSLIILITITNIETHECIIDIR